MGRRCGADDSDDGERAQALVGLAVPGSLLVGYVFGGAPGAVFTCLSVLGVLLVVLVVYLVTQFVRGVREVVAEVKADRAAAKAAKQAAEEAAP